MHGQYPGWCITGETSNEEESIGNLKENVLRFFQFEAISDDTFQFVKMNTTCMFG